MVRRDWIRILRESCQTSLWASKSLWPGHQGTPKRSSHAGRVSQATANLKRDLLIEDGFSGVQQCPIRALRLGRIGQLGAPVNTPGGLATFDDGSTAGAAE